MSLLEAECVALSPQLGPLRILPLHAGLGGGGGVQHIYEPDLELSSLSGGHGPEGGDASAVRRKVVVADALAEASFSLHAVRYVIDTGLQLTTVSPDRSEPADTSNQSNERLSAGLQPADQSQLPDAEAHQQGAGGAAEAAAQQRPAW